MADALRISVVVVSFGRARALARCLTALHQMTHTQVEVIVVADPDGLAVAGTLSPADRVQLLRQDEPNISAARNAGIAAASGDIIAFIDDDAVPEPTWAKGLADAFAEQSLSCVTGPVLGRNGISLQWARMAVDGMGRDRKLLDGDALKPDEALKLQGTNMAFRQRVFAEIGGFDPAFHFYMDDTDLALRVQRAGLAADYVKTAVVHHGFAASTRRTEDRVPLSLFDIGASTAVFLRKHAPGADHADELLRLEEDQRIRLLRFARKRKLDTRQLRGLMESLLEGVRDGETRNFGDVGITQTGGTFTPIRDAPPPEMQALSAWSIHGARLRSAAASRVADGHPTSLFLFEPTPRKHKVTFTEGGWWEQTGGVYGPSDRGVARVQIWSFSARAQAEQARVAELRGLSRVP